jgi:endo-1,4-beta-D-glucanase Y
MLINKSNGTAVWQPLLNTTFQTYYIPFSMLYPQWVPAPGGANGGCALQAATGDPKCQAPTWNPASALSLQISVLSDFAMTSGMYNVIVDDVMFYKRAATGTPVDLPAPPNTAGAMHPFPQNLSVGANCRKPIGPAVDGKYLTWAYQQWKDRFVVSAGSGLRVQRPEVGNDTVSEGIAYGMLIGVYMNDKALFDGLWTYWKANPASGPLMTWITGGSGTATDADEDAAFAMLMASRQWGGSPAGDSMTYAANAQNLMHAVLATDMSGSYIKGGSNYSATQVTNPSYFSPAWYRVFAQADTTTANAAAWTGLANGAYTLLGAISGSSANGLYPAWCTGGSCNAPATNSGSQNPAQDMDYQYDSHRIPFRIGLDYCWNGTAAATAHLSKNAAFFSGKAAAGVGRVLDIYTTGGGDVTGSAPNSASILGTSAVGAMSSATYQTYLNDAYQAVFDMVTKATLAPVDTQNRTPYSYYNATVGLLTLLAMTGNLTVF